MKLRFLGPPKVGEKQCTLVNTTTFGRKNKKKKVGENNGQLRFVRHHGLRTQARLDQNWLSIYPEVGKETLVIDKVRLCKIAGLRLASRVSGEKNDDNDNDSLTCCRVLKRKHAIMLAPCI